MIMEDIVTGPDNLPQFEDRVLYHVVDLTGDLPVGFGEGVSESDIAIRLANELNVTPEFVRSGEFHSSWARSIVLAAVEELKTEGMIDRYAVSGPWTIKPTRRGRSRVAQWRKEWARNKKSSLENSSEVQPRLRDAQEAWVEVARLRRELQLAKRTLPSLIVDDELRRRCEDLLTAENHYDRVIREACVILEDRVRSTIGSRDQLTGVPLMELAFSPNSGPLQFSQIHQEQLGAMQLYRSIMAFFRNTAGHHLIDTYSQDDALRFVAWIDLLLAMLNRVASPTSTATNSNP